MKSLNSVVQNARQRKGSGKEKHLVVIEIVKGRVVAAYGEHCYLTVIDWGSDAHGPNAKVQEIKPSHLRKMGYAQAAELVMAGAKILPDFLMPYARTN